MLHVGGTKKTPLWKSVAYCPAGGRDRYGGRCDLVFSVEAVGVSTKNLSVRVFVSYLTKEAKFCYQNNNAS